MLLFFLLLLLDCMMSKGGGSESHGFGPAFNMVLLVVVASNVHDQSLVRMLVVVDAIVVVGAVPHRRNHLS